MLPAHSSGIRNTTSSLNQPVRTEVEQGTGTEFLHAMALVCVIALTNEALLPTLLSKLDGGGHTYSVSLCS